MKKSEFDLTIQGITYTADKGSVPVYLNLLIHGVVVSGLVLGPEMERLQNQARHENSIVGTIMEIEGQTEGMWSYLAKELGDPGLNEARINDEGISDTTRNGAQESNVDNDVLTLRNATMHLPDGTKISVHTWHGRISAIDAFFPKQSNDGDAKAEEPLLAMLTR